jgi:hypothetical protein
MLDQELGAFEAHKEQWRKDHPGKFIVVKGDALLGAFSTHDEALAAGVRAYGLQGFLVRNVEEDTKEVSVPAYTLGLLGGRNTVWNTGDSAIA